MDDDIKITVVATGFDTRERPPRPIFRELEDDHSDSDMTAPITADVRESAVRPPLFDDEPLPKPSREPVANRFAAGPFIDEPSTFEDDPDGEETSLFDEPVKPAVASIEPDIPKAKTAEHEDDPEKTPKSEAPPRKRGAKSLIERASRAVTGAGSEYDEDDLDVPAFIRRKK
jgi:hypothetical protein